MLPYADPPSDDWSRASTRHALIARIAHHVSTGQPVAKAAHLIEPRRRHIDAEFARQLHTALLFRSGLPENRWRDGLLALLPEHASEMPPAHDWPEPAGIWNAIDTHDTAFVRRLLAAATRFGWDFDIAHSSGESVFDYATRDEAIADLLHRHADGENFALMREDPIESVEKRAATGETPAIYELGRRHLEANEDEKALDAFRRAADDRYSAAILMVGQLLKEGRGTAQDPAEARKWFIEAAMIGNASAQRELAEDLLSERDVDEALYWFESSMRGGELSAGLRLSFLYTGLEGVPANHRRSYFWLERAAVEEYPDAVAELGRRFENGDSIVEKDVVHAIDLYDRAIALGSSDAAYYLGGLVEEGDHIEQNIDDALQLYQSAATGGTTEAWFAAGRLLWQEMDDVEGARACFEMGVKEDDIKCKFGLAQILMTSDGPSSADLKYAAQLLRQAAAAGLATAKINLVDASEDPDFMRLRGAHAFALTPDEVRRFIIEAAEDGDGYASLRAGIIYLNEKEHERALQYFMLGADAGDVRCMNKAARCEEALGRPERAVEWYREAAANGDRDSAFNLAQMYRLGKGVAKNVAEAKKWYAVAAEAGDEDAKKILRKL